MREAFQTIFKDLFARRKGVGLRSDGYRTNRISWDRSGLFFFIQICGVITTSPKSVVSAGTRPWCRGDTVLWDVGSLTEKWRFKIMVSQVWMGN